jgi:hypothetical protein
MSMVEKTEKLKLQEKLSDLLWLQNDESHLVKLIDQKYRELMRVSKTFQPHVVLGDDSLKFYVSKTPIGRQQMHSA